MNCCHMSEDYAIWEVPLLRAFVYKACATEAQPWQAVERATPGYIAQEAQRNG